MYGQSEDLRNIQTEVEIVTLNTASLTDRDTYDSDSSINSDYNCTSFVIENKETLYLQYSEICCDFDEEKSETLHTSISQAKEDDVISSSTPEINIIKEHEYVNRQENDLKIVVQDNSELSCQHSKDTAEGLTDNCEIQNELLGQHHSSSDRHCNADNQQDSNDYCVKLTKSQFTSACSVNEPLLQIAKNASQYNHRQFSVRTRKPVVLLKDILQDKCSAKYLSRREDKEKQVQIEKNEFFGCEECGRNFSSRKYLLRHQLIHKKPLSECYRCDLCSKMFRFRGNLIEHLKRHGEHTSYYCSVCSKGFKVKGDLVDHLEIHDENTRRPCKHCGKMIRHMSDHMKIHKYDKRHQCQMCGISFTYLNQLQRHENIHTGLERYTCDICNKSYTNRSNIQLHLRLHTNEKLFSCTKCEKSFHAKFQLLQHVRCHSTARPFQCDVCTLTFKQKAHLIKHLRQHTVEKIFQCNICSTSFEQGKILLSHVRHKHTHLKSHERPYNCKKCKIEYAKKSEFLSHLDTHKT